MSAPGYIANFDSASAMLRATASALRQEDFPTVGIAGSAGTKPLKLLGGAINSLPRAIREQVYIWSGWNEAINDTKLNQVSMERLSEWAVREYPRSCTGEPIAAAESARPGTSLRLETGKGRRTPKTR